jgi:hypothetical protein
MAPGAWDGRAPVELALKILLGDLEILQGHVRALVAEEFYKGGRADTSAQHLSPGCVSKLVRGGPARHR